MSKKPIVICLPSNQKHWKSFVSLREETFLKDVPVIFLSVIKQENFTFDLAPYSWPDKELFEEIKSSFEKEVENFAKELGINNKQIALELSPSPKARIAEVLKDKNAGMVVVATRGKHGIEGMFSSSTTEYLLKHAHCPLYVLRA